MNYKRTVLFETEAFEVVACEWGEQSSSPMHSHGDSSCAVLVQEGVFQNVTQFGFKTETEIKKAGEFFSTPVGASHEILCLSPFGKTVHVYSPKVTKTEKQMTWNPQPVDIDEKVTLQSSQKSLPWSEVVDLLKWVESKSLKTSSPYFMNQLFSGIFPQTIVAQNVISRSRTTLATSEASPVFSKIEQSVIEQLCRQIGWLSAEAGGLTVPGGSAANMMAIHCARYQRFPEGKEQGHDGRRWRVYVSQDAHYSFKKSAAALGLGTNNIVSVPVNEFGQMKVAAVEEQIKLDMESGFHPLMIAATAGTTVYGAFDPIDTFSELAKKWKLWLHVDAAWGAPALFSLKAKSLIQGIEKADSVTFDAHKFFGSNLTCSFFLIAQESILFSANDVKGGDYLFHQKAAKDRGRMSWQCGRGADVLSFWTLWKHLGDEGMQRAIDDKLLLKDQVIDWIKTQPRLRLVRHAGFLNICIEVLPRAETSSKDWSVFVRERLRDTDVAMVNYFQEEGRSFLRLILVHPELQLIHIQHILSEALDIF